MYHEQKVGDEVISRPPKGKGASLTIRYRLPRSAMPVSEAPRWEKPQADVLARRVRSGFEFVDRSRPVAGYDFTHICEVEPLKNPDGTVKQYMPQNQYENLGDIALNK